MENARKLDLRLVIGALALAFAAAALWAATALAGGSSSSGAGEPATSQIPAAAFVQDDGQEEQDDPAPSREDCPERGDEGVGSGSSDTSGSDL